MIMQIESKSCLDEDIFTCHDPIPETASHPGPDGLTPHVD